MKSRSSYRKMKSEAKKAVGRYNANWVARSVVTAIPMVALEVMAFVMKFPTFMNLLTRQDDDGDYDITILGIIVISLGIAFIIIETLANKLSVSNTKWRPKYEKKQMVLESVGEYHKQTNGKMQESYHKMSYEDNNLKNYICYEIAPKGRTGLLMNAICRCLSAIYGAPLSCFLASVAISVDGGEWDWLYAPECEGVEVLNKLLNTKSTFKDVVDGKLFVFYNDKQEAANMGLYILDNRDRNNQNVGSIICWEVDASIVWPNSINVQEKHTIRTVISVSTYGQKLISTKKNNDAVNSIYSEELQKEIIDKYQPYIQENYLWLALHQFLK